MGGDIQFSGRRATGAIRIGDLTKVTSMKKQVVGDRTFEYYDPADTTTVHGIEGDYLSGTVGMRNFRVDGAIVTDDDGSQAVAVVVAGSEAATVANLRDAINANPPFEPLAAVVDPVDSKVLRLAAERACEEANAVALSNTVGDASYAQSGATLVGGARRADRYVEAGVYAVTALDVAAANVMIPLELPHPQSLLVQYRKSTGEEHLSITDKAVITSVGGVNYLKVFQAGSTHLAQGDEVHFSVGGSR
jgi:hypothetical protein